MFVTDANLNIPFSFSGFENSKEDQKGTVVTMGDFDGFHFGHQKLIERAKKKASELNLPTVLLTFHPSPKQVLGKLQKQNVIFCKNEKIALAQHFGLDAIVFIPFDKNISRLSAKEFVHSWLINYLHTKYLVIGYDHHFGYKQEGNYDFLKTREKEFSFQVERVKEIKLLHGKVSSSQIRILLESGNIKKTNELLRFAFFVESVVIKGKNRGKELGFPTANIKIVHDKILPQDGVYFVMVEVRNKKHQNVLKRGVVNIGKNPTFQNDERSLEVHILDFHENIYGENIRVFFLQKLRGEKKFSSPQVLAEQITSDVKKSRELNISPSISKKLFLK